MRSTTKNGKSEMRQIIWDGPKWKIGTNHPRRREYLFYCGLNGDYSYESSPPHFLSSCVYVPIKTPRGAPCALDVVHQSPIWRARGIKHGSRAQWAHSLTPVNDIYDDYASNMFSTIVFNCAWQWKYSPIYFERINFWWQQVPYGSLQKVIFWRKRKRKYTFMGEIN